MDFVEDVPIVETGIHPVTRPNTIHTETVAITTGVLLLLSSRLLPPLSC
jgi:hypothetical protein